MVVKTMRASDLRILNPDFNISQVYDESTQQDFSITFFDSNGQEIDTSDSWITGDVADIMLASDSYKLWISTSSNVEIGEFGELVINDDIYPDDPFRLFFYEANQINLLS